MQFKRVSDYWLYLRNKVAQPQYHLVSQVHKIRYIEYRKEKGVLLAEAIVFADNASLRFYEEIELQNGTVNRSKYTYHYTSGNYYFRYDKDPTSVRPFEHALCHLHVLQEAPHYITHDARFEEVFDFIIANFYQP